MINTGGPFGTLMRHSRFYLRHHTTRRADNLGKTLAALVARPLHTWNMPISLKIEPSAACQLACPGCVQANPDFKQKTAGNLMSQALFLNVLDQAADYVYRIQFYFNGEPFINKNILNMVAAATDRGIGSQMSTNFSFRFKDSFYRDIVESGLEHLIISMDGTDANTYGKYRINGRFELVQHGMREIVKWKRALGRTYPIVEWQFIIFEHNKHQVQRAQQLANEIGVDRLCLKYDGQSSPEAWTPLDRTMDRMSRRVMRLDACLWLWGAMIINWDGVVNPCCNKAMSVPLGDLRQRSLREIWNSDEIKELRAFVRSSPKDRERPEFSSHPCHGCRYIM